MVSQFSLTDDELKSHIFETMKWLFIYIYDYLWYGFPQAGAVDGQLLWKDIQNKIKTDNKAHYNNKRERERKK